MISNEGIKNIWIKLLAWAGIYRKLLLFELKYDVGNKGKVSHSRDVRILGKEDIDKYISSRPETDRAEVLHRLRIGHFCLILFSGEIIISAGWVATNKAYIKYLKCWIELLPNEIYDYDSFVLPEYRGKDLFSQIVLFRTSYILEKGFSRGIAAIHYENKPALSRINKNKNISHTGTIGYVRIGFWKKYFCKLEPEYVKTRTPLKILTTP